MSVSDRKRIESRRLTLTIMLNAVADRRFSELQFDTEHPAFKEILVTTWRELLDEGLVESMRLSAGLKVRLTAMGWLRAMELSGQLHSEATVERCTKIVQVLKMVVKGRTTPHDQFTGLDVVAHETGIADGWIYNVLKSYMLLMVFPNVRWDAEIDRRSSNFVRVSPTFGLNEISD